MQKLYNLIQDISLKDILEIEKNDPTFTPLIWLYNQINNKEYFLPLVVTNALICYQLSSTGEKYWKEFSEHASKKEYHKESDIFDFFTWFLAQSQWNKRLVPTKLRRLEKLRGNLMNISVDSEIYYNDMKLLQLYLGDIMKQKHTDKTIVFAVKMFGYWSRIHFWEIKIYPKKINIPIDSRLENIYKKYGWNIKNSTIFYDKLSKKLDIPPLHLDAVLWVHYEKFIN